VVNVFRKAQRRVAALRDSVGYTTAVDEFTKELRSIFDDTRSALEAVMTRAQLSDPDDVSRIGGLKAGAVGAVGAVVAGATTGAVLGQATGLGALFGVAGFIAGPVAGVAFSVATRKKRLLDACDAAAAALDDAKGAVLAAIRAG
jgi:hypothetical protein